MAVNGTDFAIPVDGKWSGAEINGMSVLVVDFAANTKAWLDAVNTE